MNTSQRMRVEVLKYKYLEPGECAVRFRYLFRWPSRQGRYPRTPLGLVP